MSLEERLEQAEKLVAEVKAELAAMRATKRNWPERIEAGMCFAQANGSRHLVCGTKLVNLDTGALWLLGGGPSGDDKTDLLYLGKMDLTIRTDAHEPTGAELVGKVCEFSDDGVNWIASGECGTYDRNDENCTYRAKDFEVRSSEGCNRPWFRFARLAK